MNSKQSGCTDCQQSKAMQVHNLILDCAMTMAGVLRDEDEAVRMSRLSAEQGHANALFFLAVRYLNGTGVVRDEVEAVRLFRLAAEQGNADAQYNLAVCYDKGTGVRRDEGEAARMYQLSAARQCKSTV